VEYTEVIQVLSVTFAFLLLAACSHPVSNLPDYGNVPEFSMTDSSGQTFHSGALAGKVWIADFIYTNCPAECPMMTSKMHSVAKQLIGQQDVQLVSISVDPARDTPPVLREFARRYDAPTQQWTFLTGTPETIHQVAFVTFHVGDVIGKIEHSTKFVVVDKHGHIRGYYSSLAADGIPTMLKDVSTLRADG
jgi:cytochrome oxidase Cu insertion factor (SCO1/SenC/PrrC family)